MDFCSDWNQFSLQLVGGILFGSAMYDTGNIWIRRCAGRSDGTNFLPKIRMVSFHSGYLPRLAMTGFSSSNGLHHGVSVWALSVIDGDIF